MPRVAEPRAALDARRPKSETRCQPPDDGPSPALEYTRWAAHNDELGACLRATLEQLGHGPEAVEEAERKLQAGRARIAEEQRIVAEMRRLSEAQRARMRPMKVDAASRSLLRTLATRAASCTARWPRSALRGSPRRRRNVRSSSSRRGPPLLGGDDDEGDPSRAPERQTSSTCGWVRF
jgi:hypothetical protein